VHETLSNKLKYNNKSKKKQQQTLLLLRLGIEPSSGRTKSPELTSRPYGQFDECFYVKMFIKWVGVFSLFRHVFSGGS
jgi:hypothetical protein